MSIQTQGADGAGTFDHEFKSAPSVFYPAARGEKMFEYRRDDRGGYEVGQTVRLRCYDAGSATYLPEPPLDRRITNILRGGEFELPQGYCILSLAPLADGAGTKTARFKPGDLVRNARYGRRDAYPAFGESAYVQAVDGDYLDFGQGSKLLYSLFDPVIPAPATPPGVPDNLRALSEAATQGEWFTESEKSDGSYGSGEDTSEGYLAYNILTDAKTRYGKPGVIAETSNSTLGVIHEDSDEDGHTAWDETARANTAFIVAAVNHVRAVMAAQPAGQEKLCGYIECAALGKSSCEDCRGGQADNLPDPETAQTNLARIGAAMGLQSKPVAWLLEKPDGETHLSECRPRDDWKDGTVTPLYAAPIIQLVEQEDPERCIACAEPLKAGEHVLSDASGGMIHASCCGPERESYTGADGEPLGPNDPIPQGYAYEGRRPAGQAGDAGEEAPWAIEEDGGFLWVGPLRADGTVNLVFETDIRDMSPSAQGRARANARRIVAAVNSTRTGAAETEELREEVAYWRRDLSARLWSLTALYKAALDRGEGDRAADLANAIRPALASYHDAEAGEWHERCELCGEFVRDGEPRAAWEDVSGHARCLSEDGEGRIYPHGEKDLARQVEAAQAALDAPWPECALAARPEAPSDARWSFDLTPEQKPIKGFSNRAGETDTDDAIAAELETAGIEVYRLELLRKTSGEVKTAVRGDLHGWLFTRAWRYWVAEGPGIELAAADILHAAHPDTVRVNGHCGCPSPREQNHGLAVGSYHVDSPAGLKGLADTIKALVNRATAPSDPAPSGQEEG